MCCLHSSFCSAHLAGAGPNTAGAQTTSGTIQDGGDEDSRQSGAFNTDHLFTVSDVRKQRHNYVTFVHVERKINIMQQV